MSKHYWLQSCGQGLLDTNVCVQPLLATKSWTGVTGYQCLWSTFTSYKVKNKDYWIPVFLSNEILATKSKAGFTGYQYLCPTITGYKVMDNDYWTPVFLSNKYWLQSQRQGLMDTSVCVQQLMATKS